jgi:outer membrane protein assembly factor BamB
MERKEKMKFSRKTMTAIITLVLTLTIAATLLVLPAVNAHDPAWNIPTTAYCSISPGTIGIGQYTVIIVFLDRYSPTASGVGGQYLSGFQLDITKPDGTTEIIGPWQCRSAVGSDYQVYTPDQVGTYSIVFSFAGETIVEGVAPQYRGLPYVGDYFEPSTSNTVTLTVQQDPVEGWQEPALPTEYWERPITAANRGWSKLASNWLKGTWLENDIQRSGEVPKTAHVLWTDHIIPGAYAGGIADERWGPMPAAANDYESVWSEPIIMNGRVYYNAPDVADSQRYGYYCRDLYTGEVLWYKNGTDNGLNNPYTTRGLDTSSTRGSPGSQKIGKLDRGYMQYWAGVNGEGVLSYLIYTVFQDPNSTWYFLDAETGNYIFGMEHVPGGTQITDQDGNLVKYTFDSDTGTVQCWNASQIIGPGSPVGSLEQQWKPATGYMYDAVNDTLWTDIGVNTQGQIEWTERDVQPRTGLTMNVTNPDMVGLAGGISKVCQDDTGRPKALFRASFSGTSGISTGITQDVFRAWYATIDEGAAPYSPYPDGTATINTNLGYGTTLVWSKDITVPLPGENHTWSLVNTDYDSKTFQILCKQTSGIYTYNLETGNLMWGPTTSFNAFDFYGYNCIVYQGQLLTRSQYGGNMAAYDIQTGNLNWVYNATAKAPYEAAYGDNMPLIPEIYCDGYVICYSDEHSPTKPLWRDSNIRCINLANGEEVWELLQFDMGSGLADGIIVGASEYDHMIYAIGKGPSETTVTASPKVVPKGTGVIIEGMVIDISPGTEASVQAKRFPNGVPAVTDADQQAWMEYVYEQQAYPTDCQGVEVTIDAFDPSGNYINIGRATTDLSGSYSLLWEPPEEGKYTIIATFEGSEAYWASYAETALGVGPVSAGVEPTTEPPTTAPPTSAPPTPPTGEAPLITTEVAIIAAVAIIAVIAIAAYWVLRRRQ